MPIKEKRNVVLVTGGTGFVGSHLLLTLHNSHVYSIVIDNLSNSKLPDFFPARKSSVDFIEAPTMCFHRVDIRHKDRLRDILSKHDIPDVCIHLAAKISIADSLKDPQGTFDINVNGTKNVLEICAELGTKKFVFASSAAVYGNAKRFPLSELEDVRPISPYGESKLKGEQLVSKYMSEIPNALSVRFFNIYGKGQSPEYAGVITKFAERLEDDLPPVIHGDGRQTRDFISVQDIVRAIMLAGKIGSNPNNENTPDRIIPDVFNIGTGFQTEILDLAHMMIEIYRKKKAGKISAIALKPEFIEAVEGDVTKSYADISRADRYLGFTYQDELRAGLERMYAISSV